MFSDVPGYSSSTAPRDKVSPTFAPQIQINKILFVHIFKKMGTI